MRWFNYDPNSKEYQAGNRCYDAPLPRPLRPLGRVNLGWPLIAIAVLLLASSSAIAQTYEAYQQRFQQQLNACPACLEIDRLEKLGYTYHEALALQRVRADQSARVRHLKIQRQLVEAGQTQTPLTPEAKDARLKELDEAIELQGKLLRQFGG